MSNGENLKPIPSILILFLFTQLLGLFVGITLINESVVHVELQDLNVAPGGDSSSPSSSGFFLLYVLLGAVVMVLVLKFYKGLLLFKLLEGVMLLITSNIVFYVLFFFFKVPYDFIFALIFSIAIVVLKFFRSELKNLTAVLASAGVGAIFGFSLDVLPAALFMIGLSIYDFLSVFWTGHMVFMAKELAKKDLSFSVAVADTEPSEGKEEKSTLELGTGDMAIPLMLAVSAFKLSFNPLHSLLVVFGSLIGLYLALDFVMKKRAFLPALPPISFFALLALFISAFLLR